MAHNEHLQEPIIERSRGEAKGICYKGVALTSADFILIAPSIEILKEKWSLFTDVPLNEDKCVEVALFAQKDLVETATPPQ